MSLCASSISAAASNFYIDVYVDRQPSGCGDIGDYYLQVSSLSAGGNANVPISITNGVSAGGHQIYAYVDIDCNIIESNEDNNLYGPVLVTASDELPDKPTIIAPIGLIDYPAPEYQWEHVANATRYRMAIRNSSNVIVVWKTFAAADICSGSLCTAAPGNFLSNGDYILLVQATNDAGKSKWGFAAFTVDAVGDFPPGASMIYYPIGTIADTTPEYEWEHLSNAEQYKLAVKDTSGTILIWKTYNAVDICSGDFCKADPGTSLTDGDYTILILPTNSLGNGTWTGEDFAIDSSGQSPPGATVIYEPMGTISDTTPTYQWKHLSNATQYKLAVKDPGKTVIVWRVYSAGDICSSSVCTANPGVVLPPNDYSVWVLAVNSYGNGIWTYRYFTIE